MSYCRLPVSECVIQRHIDKVWMDVCVEELLDHGVIKP